MTIYFLFFINLFCVVVKTENFKNPQINTFSHKAIIMKTTLADERGRIVLGTKFLHKYGKKFAVVGTPKEIVLVPIAKDPIAELKKLGKEAGIDKYTLAELKKIATKEAEKEISSAMKNVR